MTIRRLAGGLLLLALAPGAAAQAPKRLPGREEVLQQLVPKTLKTSAIYAAGPGVRDHRTDLADSTVQVGPATPAPLVLLVPVTARRLHPALRSLRVVCSVSTLTSFRPDPLKRTGGGVTEQPLVGGSFRGTLAVGIQPDTGKDVGQMSSYHCTLQVQDGTEWMSARNDKYPVNHETLKLGASDTIR